MVKGIIGYIPFSPERISGKNLSIATGQSERENRNDICKARIDGVIIASDERGYYIPQTPQEMSRYYRKHRAAAMTTLKSLKAVRRALQAAGMDVRQIERHKNSEKT